MNEHLIKQTRRFPEIFQLPTFNINPLPITFKVSGRLRTVTLRHPSGSNVNQRSFGINIASLAYRSFNKYPCGR
eukprot:scaffold656_cov271-Chaetoceros_neogracile.AAC.51